VVGVWTVLTRASKNGLATLMIENSTSASLASIVVPSTPATQIPNCSGSTAARDG